MGMTRRRFLATSGFALGGSALLGLSGDALAREGNAKRPNVVLIMADDCGIELFKAYGSESHRTPVLDALAAEGVVFRHCYATPLCTPTRVSIMTGRYNHRNYTTFGAFPKDDETRTFGNLMKKAGYATCMAGKWQFKGVSIARMGFDATLRCDCWRGYWTTGSIWANEKPLKTAEPTYRPDIVNRFVLDFIEANRARPFFVYYPMFLIHHPEQPSPDHSDTKLIEKCKRGFAEPIRQESVFRDMVTYMDSLVGNVVRKLDELGIRENTIILFTGDNGTSGHQAIVNGERLSGGKGSMSDSGTRVPLIANWKGTAKPAVVDDLVDVTDFYATLADVGGVSLAPPAWVSARPAAAALPPDGVSFLPRLRGERGTPREWAFVLFDRNGCVLWRQCVKKGELPPEHLRQGSFWARTQRWKLYGDGRLYDVARDPRETQAIAAANDTQESARVRAMLSAVFRKLKVAQSDLITFDGFKARVQGAKPQR